MTTASFVSIYGPPTRSTQYGTALKICIDHSAESGSSHALTHHAYHTERGNCADRCPFDDNRRSPAERLAYQ